MTVLRFSVFFRVNLAVFTANLKMASKIQNDDQNSTVFGKHLIFMDGTKNQTNQPGGGPSCKLGLPTVQLTPRVSVPCSPIRFHLGGRCGKKSLSLSLCTCCGCCCSFYYFSLLYFFSYHFGCWYFATSAPANPAPTMYGIVADTIC